MGCGLCNYALAAPLTAMTWRRLGCRLAAHPSLRGLSLYSPTSHSFAVLLVIATHVSGYAHPSCSGVSRVPWLGVPSRHYAPSALLCHWFHLRHRYPFFCYGVEGRPAIWGLPHAPSHTRYRAAATLRFHVAAFTVTHLCLCFSIFSITEMFVTYEHSVPIRPTRPVYIHLIALQWLYCLFS